MLHRINDLDVFFITYDEPGTDETYLRLVQTAKRTIYRVHGVKGFHAAHQKCAEMSSTKRFVTIDADNDVGPGLFEQTIDDAEGKDLVFSYRARNAVNGLEYGNGGVKVWPRGLVMQVPTHELGPDETENDFCWKYRYMQVDYLASTVRYQSEKQAFRAGFREAVKLSLVEGKKLGSWRETAEVMNVWNRSRLNVWLSVGADAAYGIWTMRGARTGLAALWGDRVSLDQINDYDFFDQLFETIDSDMASADLAKLGISAPIHSPKTSIWFKQTYINPPRVGIMNPVVQPVDFDDV